LVLLSTGKVLLAGGSIIYNGKASSVPRADLYHPATNAWVGTGILKQAGQANHTDAALQWASVSGQRFS